MSPKFIQCIALCGNALLVPIQMGTDNVTEFCYKSVIIRQGTQKH